MRPSLLIQQEEDSGPHPCFHPCNIPRVTPSCRKHTDLLLPLPHSDLLSIYAIAC
jgi:hypothetical protein